MMLLANPLFAQLGSPRYIAQTMRRSVARRFLGLKGRCDIPANISRHHPDYGMTVAEHEAAKAARAATA